MHVAGKGFDARKCRPAILVVLCLEHWVTRTKPRASFVMANKINTADRLRTVFLLVHLGGHFISLFRHDIGECRCFHIFHVNERLLERETHQKRKTVTENLPELDQVASSFATVSSSVLLYRLNSCTTCLAKPDK